MSKYNQGGIRMNDELKRKIEESKYNIGYSKGDLRPGATEFTNIIIVDDIIYKTVNGQVTFLKDQKEKIDKVWNYVNAMQGVIRSEAERVKELSHMKDSHMDQITFTFDGENFTLTSKVTDEKAVNFYNEIVKEILDIIK